LAKATSRFAKATSRFAKAASGFAKATSRFAKAASGFAKAASGLTEVASGFVAIEGTIRAYTVHTLNAFKKIPIANIDKVTLEFGIKVGGEADIP